MNNDQLLADLTLWEGRLDKWILGAEKALEQGKFEKAQAYAILAGVGQDQVAAIKAAMRR